MNSGVSKARTRSSGIKQSKALQEKLQDLVASTGSGIGLPMSQGESQTIGDHTEDQPLKSRKRQLDTASEIEPLLTKKACLTQTSTQRHGAQHQFEQVAKVGTRIVLFTSQPLTYELMQTTLRQPKPISQPPYASFLKDPTDPDPRYTSNQTLVSNWLESLEADRRKSCRSDSHLDYPDSSIPSRQLTRSAPEMSRTRDSDGFVLPPTPSTLGSRSSPSNVGSAFPSDITSRSSGRSLVEDPFYRDLNLADNGIYMRPISEKLPDSIASLISNIGKDRASPGPSQDSVSNDANLYQLKMGGGEPEVEEYFRNNIYPSPNATDTLKRGDKQPMSKHNIPNTRSKLRVSNPVPDMLYGYSREAAFSQQQPQLVFMGAEPAGNNNGLMYPFFVIEFKGDGPNGSGSMWVATNQCLGGSTSCVNIIERLNYRLERYIGDKTRSINSAAFSIAMNGREATLYISWKHDEINYYMREVRGFLLQDPEHYVAFRKYVRNIIDWGNGTRLNEIRDALETLLEENRKSASEAAKSRQPPSDDSVAGSGKKQRGSSSRSINTSDSV